MFVGGVGQCNVKKKALKNIIINLCNSCIFQGFFTRSQKPAERTWGFERRTAAPPYHPAGTAGLTGTFCWGKFWRVTQACIGFLMERWKVSCEIYMNSFHGGWKKPRLWRNHLWMLQDWNLFHVSFIQEKTVCIKSPLTFYWFYRHLRGICSYVSHLVVIAYTGLNFDPIRMKLHTGLHDQDISHELVCRYATACFA